MDLIAKTGPVETIEQHTAILLEAFEVLKAIYFKCFTDKEIKLIYLAAKYHDKGKAIYVFQRSIYYKIGRNLPLSKELVRILNKKFMEKEIPHGYLSPAFILKEDLKGMEEADKRILINAIVFHHNRKKEFKNEEVKFFVNEDLKERFGDEVNTNYRNKVYSNLPWQISDEEWVRYAVVKGMLNKLDYWASGCKNESFEIAPDYNGGVIGEIVENTLINKYGSIREVQQYMKKHKEYNNVVIASTGIGKTEAALIWIGESKGFYTLPLKVSINAIYKRILEKYKYPKEKLGLLHGDALSYMLENRDKNSNDDFYTINSKYEASRKFSYPLTVCTVDQLFKFVYKYNGSEMFLAVLKYSKLILDEIQAYSADIIGKLIYGLKLITMAGGKFSILTATFPPIIRYFMKKAGIQFVEAEKPFFISEPRHIFSYKKGDFDFEDIAVQSKSKKVLVICNTVKKAQEVYGKLKDLGTDCYILHARFTQEDKRFLEDEIQKFAKTEGKSGVWVCTQIVEASLDIDFDLLYTEMCPADSLLQRIGRCFRNRIYKDKFPNIKIYDTGNGVQQNDGKNFIYDKFIYDRSVELLIKYEGIIFSEESKNEYINEVYSLEKLKGSEFFKKIEKAIENQKDILPGEYERRDANKDFRDIMSIMVIPESVYNSMVNSGMDELLEKCALKGEEAILAKKAIIDKTIVMPYKLRYKYVDNIPLSKYIDVYKTSRRYEFNKENCSGRGLLDVEEEIENFL